MLDPLALALQGVGYSPMTMLVQGYIEVEIEIEPVYEAPGSAGNARPHEDVKEYKIHIKTTFNGEVTRKSYTLSQGPVFLNLKYGRLISKPIKITAKFLNRS